MKLPAGARVLGQTARLVEGCAPARPPRRSRGSDQGGHASSTSPPARWCCGSRGEVFTAWTPAEKPYETRDSRACGVLVRELRRAVRAGIERRRLLLARVSAAGAQEAPGSHRVACVTAISSGEPRAGGVMDSDEIQRRGQRPPPGEPGYVDERATTG
jgi:hypothetical protein